MNFITNKTWPRERVLLAVGMFALLFGAFSFATTVGAENLEIAGPEPKVEICHVLGAVEFLTVPASAVAGHEGHDDFVIEDETDRQECQRLIDAQDVCTNIDGIQLELPDGHEFVDEGICEELTVDYCDPSQRPAGMDIAEWLQANQADGSDCFDYEVTQQCGQLDVQFIENLTPYDYSFYYAIGNATPALANWAGDGPLPVLFSEDEYGGSTDVTYYVTGPEADYFTGFGIPNIWDGNGTTVQVDTDCVDDSSATVVVQKIVCDAESYLPDWAPDAGAPVIDEDTAAEFLAEEDNGEHCALEDWEFQWAPFEGTTNPGDNIAEAGEPWTTFSSEAQIELGDDTSSIWVREVTDSNYIPFTGESDTNPTSAEMYCYDDSHHYDNYDKIRLPEAGETYYCIAFNVLKEQPAQPVCEIGDNLLENGSFEEDVVTNDSLWQKFLNVIGWNVEKVSDASATTLEQHRGWEGNAATEGEQYAELDGDEPTRISQDVPTVEGATYELRWAFAPRQNTAITENELSVEVDGVEVAVTGPSAGIGVLSQGDWTLESHEFMATSNSTEIAFKDLGADSESGPDVGTFLDDTVLCLVREPVGDDDDDDSDNTCLEPNTLGDDEDFTLGTAPDGEDSLATIFSDNGYGPVDPEDDQQNTQVWDVSTPDTDTVTFDVTILAKNAGNTQTFGYYKAGDTSTFVPVFVIPPSSVGSTFPVSIDTSVTDSIGFAIETAGLEPDTWASEKALNTDGKDNVAVYNPVANTYLVAFEDLNENDNDYNDLVVEINEVLCTEGGSRCLIEGYKYDKNGIGLEGWEIGLSIEHELSTDVVYEDDDDDSEPYYMTYTDITDETGYYCVEEFRLLQAEFKTARTSVSLLPFGATYRIGEILKSNDWTPIKVVLDSVETPHLTGDSFFDVFVEIGELPEPGQTITADFYNEEDVPTTGGGRLLSSSSSSGGSGGSADPEPTPTLTPAGLVGGEQTSVIPAGAPNAGAGGASRSPYEALPLMALLAMIGSIVILRTTRVNEG